MGCASSKPEVNQPSASVPSSVTASNKAVGHEKSVRFADLPTEISDKRSFNDDTPGPAAGHSAGILHDVVEHGPPKNTPVAQKAVEVSPKTEEVNVHKHVEVTPAPAVVKTTAHVPEPVAVVEPPKPAAVVVENSHESHEKKDSHTHVEVNHEQAIPAPVAPVADPVVAPTSVSTTCSKEVKAEDENCACCDHPEEAASSVVTPPTPASVVSPPPAVAAPVTPVAPVAVAAAPVAVAPVVVQLVVPDKKKGYMLKQGHVVKNWKNRFFILEDGLLTYYESSTANAPYGVNKKGEMSLKEVTVSESKTLVTLSTRGKGGADLVLEIKYPNEREEWMAAFKQHTAWLKASAQSGSN